jgi:hypothetical protein
MAAKSGAWLSIGTSTPGSMPTHGGGATVRSSAPAPCCSALGPAGEAAHASAGRGPAAAGLLGGHGSRGARTQNPRRARTSPAEVVDAFASDRRMTNVSAASGSAPSARTVFEVRTRNDDPRRAMTTGAKTMLDFDEARHKIARRIMNDDGDEHHQFYVTLTDWQRVVRQTHRRGEGRSSTRTIRRIRGE